jgi:hypothetical protein
MDSSARLLKHVHGILRPNILLRDRDGIYGSVFQNRVKNLGITEVKTYTTKPVAKSILQAFNWKHSQGLPQSSNRIECQPFKANDF